MSILLLSLLLLLCTVLIVLYCFLVGIQRSAMLGEEAAAEAEAAERERYVERGLTAEELERLGEGKMAVRSGEVCVVCWDEMVEAQALRVLPGCCHAFHRSCIDVWLRRQPFCPLCRARLLPPPLPPSQPQPQTQHQPRCPPS